MTVPRRDRPDRADLVTTYPELKRFLAAFADGRQNGSVLLIGDPGLAKSREVSEVLGPRGHTIRGQTTAYGLYRMLYEHRDELLVLDDQDDLFADRVAVRLLKCLLEIDAVKTVAWHSRTARQDGLPPAFQTRSRAILITNSWATLNAHVEAVEDRAHVLVFQPSPLEVHLRVATWFWDQEVFDFVGGHLDLIQRPSMREYMLAWDRKRGNLPWREYLLGRWLTGKPLLVSRLRSDPSFATEADRVAAFVAAPAGGCRATYYNILGTLPPLADAPRIALTHRPPDPSESSPTLSDEPREQGGDFAERWTSGLPDPSTPEVQGLETVPADPGSTPMTSPTADGDLSNDPMPCSNPASSGPSELASGSMSSRRGGQGDSEAERPDIDGARGCRRTSSGAGLPTMNTPIIAVGAAEVEVRVGALITRVPGKRVHLAHLGYKLLEFPQEEIPEDLARSWDSRYGGRRTKTVSEGRGKGRRTVRCWTWAGKTGATQACAHALGATADAAKVDGVVLWDTMRKGSDYWRPGGLLTDVAEILRAREPAIETSYSREDLLCPPGSLLAVAANPEDLPMSFGEYATRYAGHLRSSGAIELAAAAVLMAMACGRIAVFCCTDSYVPGYGDVNEVLRVPYAGRVWLDESPRLREAGCHRIVLCEELVSYFTALGVDVDLFEADSTAGRAYERSFHS